MRPSEIRPDLALKALLEGQIVLRKSATESVVIDVYAQGERPNTGLASEFVEILFNGSVRSLTKPIGVLRGNVVVSVYVKSYEDGSVFQYRVDSIMKQIEEKVSSASSGDYFFEINPDNIITPTTTNIASGYSTTILNIEWHTI